MSDATQRFSNRVSDYTRYRPGYPSQAVDFLLSQVGAALSGDRRADLVVADLGSGTGIFTQTLLPHVAQVFAVEPNDAMRQEAERRLAGTPGFHSVTGTSEATGLSPGSVNLVTAAQAFHWFDRDKARAEFQRILVPGGHVALLWNKRLVDTDFLIGYEALVTSLPEYAEVTHHRVTPEVLREFFGHEPEFRSFAHEQRLDLQGVLGRLASSSYCPAPGTDEFARIRERLQGLFRAQNDETIAFHYECEVYLGTLDGNP